MIFSKTVAIFRVQNDCFQIHFIRQQDLLCFCRHFVVDHYNNKFDNTTNI